MIKKNVGIFSGPHTGLNPLPFIKFSKLYSTKKFSVTSPTPGHLSEYC